MGTERIKEVKTRKPHICDGCKKAISVGSIVQNANGIGFDEDNRCIPYNFYYCKKCTENAETNEGEEAYKEHLDI